jgi:polyisoprenoid-binding protein YceI
MLHHLFCQIALGVLFVSPSVFAAAAKAQNFKPVATSEVRFEAVGRPSLLKIKGHGAPLTGSLKIENGKASGQFEIQLDALETGIDLRNRHMKENYLKTAEFPTATLKLDEISLPAEWAAGQDLTTDFKGQLTLKGQTKAIDGKLQLKGADLSTEAQFTVKLSDFGIDVPKYMGVTVADLVHASVKIPRFERK